MEIVEAIIYLIMIVAFAYGIIYVISNALAYTVSLFINKDPLLPAIKTSHPEPQVEPPIIPYQKYMSKEEYHEYLKSDLWLNTRKLRLTIDKYTCIVCGSNLLPDPSKPDIGHVHHMHYRNLGHENVRNDLVSLCKHCHTSMHEKYTIHEMEHEINLIRMRKH